MSFVLCDEKIPNMVNLIVLKIDAFYISRNPPLLRGKQLFFSSERMSQKGVTKKCQEKVAFIIKPSILVKVSKKSVDCFYLSSKRTLRLNTLILLHLFIQYKN